MCCGTEAGSYLRRIDACITHLKAQGPPRTYNESKEEEEDTRWRPPVAAFLRGIAAHGCESYTPWGLAMHGSATVRRGAAAEAIMGRSLIAAGRSASEEGSYLRLIDLYLGHGRVAQRGLELRNLALLVVHKETSTRRRHPACRNLSLPTLLRCRTQNPNNVKSGRSLDLSTFGQFLLGFCLSVELFSRISASAIKGTPTRFSSPGGRVVASGTWQTIPPRRRTSGKVISSLQIIGPRWLHPGCLARILLSRIGCVREDTSSDLASVLDLE